MPIPIPPHPRANSRRAHSALEDQAALDFLRGDYAPVASAPAFGWWNSQPLNGYAPPGPAAPPIAPPRTYAIIEYEPAGGRVRWVIGMFGDVLTAEEYAIDRDLPRYDILPATVISREQR